VQRRLFRARRELQDTGEEPDYRFSLANERTMLAYLRTALALMAAGVALLHLSDRVLDTVAGTGLVVVGVCVAARSYSRWWQVEAALRRGQPLPLSRLPILLTVALTAAGVTLLLDRLL
jgi:putative membrane protein